MHGECLCMMRYDVIASQTHLRHSRPAAGAPNRSVALDTLLLAPSVMRPYADLCSCDSTCCTGGADHLSGTHNSRSRLSQVRLTYCQQTYQLSNTAQNFGLVMQWDPRLHASKNEKIIVQLKECITGRLRARNM